MKKGFTLMELTIVLAILAIIAAIVVPTLLAATDRARLRADLSSAAAISNAMTLYTLERGGTLPPDLPAVLERLAYTDYLDAGLAPQTNNASWYIAGDNVRLNIAAVASERVRNRAFNGLNLDEQALITGGGA
jgi:prepilin-type N-terminal cleavage/methylation domain-containing protein